MTDALFQRACALIAALGLGRAEDVAAVTPLTGGVASDIARVAIGGRTCIVKFALPRLRVAADWFAPVHRSRTEYAWLARAGQVVPGHVPRLLGYCEALHGFAMEDVAGPDVRLWKAELLSGLVRPGAARQVADVLGRIHAAGAAADFDRAPFRNRADFHALRIEPYLLHVATRHPQIAAPLQALADRLDSAEATLVHGDVSPKNILLRDSGPVLLDAECATMGDPCFDVAFCLNHLLLKAVHMPARAAALRAEVAAFWEAYAPHVGWEDPGRLGRRVAALLPALMLARIDGKSPVEYLSEPARAEVRARAIPLIADPATDIGTCLDRIGQEARAA
jgi:aminoglycoside phosphotransferase (APT) family kinase protein